MRSLIDMIYEYQLLSGKERKLDIALDDDERVRRMGLFRLLQGEVPDTRNRRFARAQLRMSVQFTRPGGFESGETRDLSGGGFCIATPKPPEPGTRLVVRVAEPAAGTEYVFPCRVVWRTRRGPARMGVEIDGVPHCADFFGDETTGVWRRSVRFGGDRDEPLVA
ncbi:MAG TPA: PilZ domain-containing protein [Sandaracinaceae bacterium LLY-WYZ-13_1]|nr:PilZ domain-containing protein [Sandaracinaceae bacterium LLY-WYZ-13_1]